MGVNPETVIDDFENCASIDTPGMIRISFGIYNTADEVDEFLELLPKAIEAAKAEQERINNAPDNIRAVEPRF